MKALTLASESLAMAKLVVDLSQLWNTCELRTANFRILVSVCFCRGFSK